MKTNGKNAAVKTNEKNAAIKRSHWLDILAFIHSYLLLTEVYPLFAAAGNLKGGQWLAYVGYSLVLLPALIGGFFMIRKIRSLPVCTLISGIYIFLTGYGATKVTVGMPEFVAFTLMPVTVTLCVIALFTRLRARIHQSQLQQDFKMDHEDLENILLDSWEDSNFLNHPHPLHWIWTAIIYMIAVLESYKTCYRILFLMTLVDVVVVFLHMYQDHFQKFIRDHHGMANMPVAMMRRVHRMLGIAGLALILVASLPAVIYHTEPLDGWRPKTHVQIPQDAIEFPEAQEAMPADALHELMEQDPIWTPPAWLLMFMQYLMYTLFACGVLGILYLIWKRIQEATRDFALDDTDEVIFLDDVAKDQADEIAGLQRPKDGFLSPNARIRRRYRRAIQKGTEGTPGKWETPTELEISARWSYSEEEKRLHDLYEKARYSEYGCSQNELQEK